MPADRRARPRRAAARVAAADGLQHRPAGDRRDRARRSASSTPRPRRASRSRSSRCETRPLLQGARLTAWELGRRGHPGDRADRRRRAARCSRAAAIDAVIVGCDRVAANGDVANKIGTYALAIAARHHGVPFYVAGPRSTLDAATADRRRDRDRAARRGRGARGRRPRRDDARSGTLPSTSRPAALDHRADHRRRRAARAVRAGDRRRAEPGVVRAAVYLGAGEIRIEERRCRARAPARCWWRCAPAGSAAAT